MEEYFVLREKDLPGRDVWIFLEKDNLDQTGALVVYEIKGRRNRGMKCVAFDTPESAAAYRAFLAEQEVSYEYFTQTTLPKKYEP